MINYVSTSQWIDKNILNKHVKYNLLVNGYNVDNTKIYFHDNCDVMSCAISIKDRYYPLEFTTLPNNSSTVYMLTLFDMHIPMHLLKSLFGALKFTNILSQNKLNDYSKEIYDNLYITELYDDYIYTKKDSSIHTPTIKKNGEHYRITNYVNYFTKVRNNDLTSIIKYDRFPYHILYDVCDNEDIIKRVEELQKIIGSKILYTYYSGDYLFNNIKEETIYSFKSMRTNSYLDIRILGE